MNIDLTELESILDQAIAVGDELNRNLETQRRALLAWDVVSLLLAIEGREPWLRLLTQLEEKRIAVLKQVEPAGAPATLRELIDQLPADQAERDRWRDLHERGRALFSRLHAEERDFNALMENLASHINEALGFLTRPAVPLYGETGATDLQTPSSVLIHRQV
ncbi:MAG: flagellar export chaperone FlgN [Deltaproteobacteria bacterium]|nr:flagellar export chaperone FlgN [Deltaproteobacteria bacterium]